MAAVEKTRAAKTGLGYVVEQKMEQNYDREEEAGTPGCVVDWINGVLEGEDGFTKIPDKDWKTICTSLRNGVILCKLINKLLKADGKPTISFSSKSTSPFVAMTNIENFNKACIDFGLSKEFTFQSGDLWEVRKGPFLNVLNGLHSLGFVANNKNITPKYSGELKKDN